MKKVSVIVPVYNTEQYLKKCIESLLNQTLEEIEIVIVMMVRQTIQSKF